jgi:hypothetical protein
MMNFVNGTKFTNDQFRTEEKVQVSMVFNIESMPSQTEFAGNLQLVTSRPVYGANYNTTLIRVFDKNIDFEFKEFEPLQFVPGTFTNNLTAILAYYAYLALGVDYDTFGSLGGTPWLTQALMIAEGAQGGGGTGWDPTAKGRDNRYWLVFQLMDERFKPLRNCLYQYHRLGFDTFTDNMEKGRAEVLSALELLGKVHQNQPNSYVLQVLMDAKRLEIISLFAKAEQGEKNKILELMERIDVANLNKYQTGLNS